MRTINISATLLLVATLIGCRSPSVRYETIILTGDLIKIARLDVPQDEYLGAKFGGIQELLNTRYPHAGIQIVVAPSVATGVVPANADDGQKRLDGTIDNVPLLPAVKYLCDGFGLVFSVNGRRITITDKR